MGQNRIEYISLASLVSAMAVIFLHATAVFTYFQPENTGLVQMS